MITKQLLPVSTAALFVVASFAPSIQAQLPKRPLPIPQQTPPTKPTPGARVPNLRVGGTDVPRTSGRAVPEGKKVSEPRPEGGRPPTVPTRPAEPVERRSSESGPKATAPAAEIDPAILSAAELKQIVVVPDAQSPSAASLSSGQALSQWTKKWSSDSKVTIWSLTETSIGDGKVDLSGASMARKPRMVLVDKGPPPRYRLVPPKGLCRFTLENENGQIDWPTQTFTPNGADIAGLEAQIDVVVPDEPVTVKLALTFKNASCNHMGPPIAVTGKAGTIMRVDLPSPLNGKSQVIKGDSASPLNGTAPVTFGIMIIPQDEASKTTAIDLANFAIRVAAKKK